MLRRTRQALLQAQSGIRYSQTDVLPLETAVGVITDSNDPDNWQTGMDIVFNDGKPGTPILAPVDGVVTYNAYQGSSAKGFGWSTVVEFTWTDGRKYEMLTGHKAGQSKIPVGTRVKPGVILGIQGKSGSTNGGEHVTFHVNALSPGGNPRAVMQEILTRRWRVN